MPIVARLSPSTVGLCSAFRLMRTVVWSTGMAAALPPTFTLYDQGMGMMGRRSRTALTSRWLPDTLAHSLKARVLVTKGATVTAGNDHSVDVLNRRG